MMHTRALIAGSYCRYLTTYLASWPCRTLRLPKGWLVPAAHQHTLDGAEAGQNNQSLITAEAIVMERTGSLSS